VTDAVDEIRKITVELAKIDEGKVKAIAEGDRVYLMIQDAPAELRKLADALEKIDVREIKALIAYAKPGAAPLRKTSSRVPKQLETFGEAKGRHRTEGPEGPAPEAPRGEISLREAKPSKASRDPSVEKRIEAVLARFRAPLKKLRAHVSLEGVKDGVASVRFRCDGDFPPDGVELQSQIRDAIVAEVPDVAKVEVV
jgi:hypothetical protein